MDINFSIDDQLTENFSEGAHQELERQAIDFVKKLINEAILMEADRRKVDGQQEITQMDVLKAAMFPEFAEKKKKPWWKKASHAAVAVLSIISGYLFSCQTTISYIAVYLILIVIVVLIIYLMED